MQAAEGRRTRGLDRAFAILGHLREVQRPLNPNEIATGIGAPRSTVYELVEQLLHGGMLEPAGSGGRVFLGRQIYFLGAAYQAQFDFTRESERVLELLAAQTRETAQFCMLDGDKYTVVRMHEGIRPFRISTDVGRRLPLPWTASGRLLVAHLTDAEILALIPAGDFIRPGGIRIDQDWYLSQVRQAARDGHFTFDSIVDSFTRCFAVPVSGPDGRVLATLCLVAPREDGQRNRDAYIAALKSAAGRLGGAPGAGQGTGYGAGLLPGSPQA